MLTDQELYSYSGEHVRYEIKQLLVLGEIFREGYSVTNEHELAKHNSLVQSFAIHLRNLISFLYPERVLHDDVIASHFVSDRNRWSADLAPLSDSLRRARERANKEVAHLTTQRIAGTPPEKAWEPVPLITELRALMQLFVRHANPARLDPRVSDVLNTYMM